MRLFETFNKYVKIHLQKFYVKRHSKNFQSTKGSTHITRLHFSILRARALCCGFKGIPENSEPILICGLVLILLSLDNVGSPDPHPPRWLGVWGWRCWNLVCQIKLTCHVNQTIHTLTTIILFCFLWFAAIQLARQLQQERTQVVCSNKEARMARRHSRNGPWTHECCFEVDTFGCWQCFRHWNGYDS